MIAICNPTNPDFLRTSYIAKGSGKKVIKFYCLEIIDKSTNKAFFIHL